MSSKQKKSPFQRLLSPAFLFFILSMGFSYYVGKYVPPTWTVEKVTIDAKIEPETGKFYYIYKGKKKFISDPIPLENSQLTKEAVETLNAKKESPSVKEEYTFNLETDTQGQQKIQYHSLTAKRHWKYWSLMPAIVAITLCWITKEPFSALLSGILSAALLLARYDLTEAVFLPIMASASVAGIILLYLILLGGLMGIWNRTGAALAFAEFTTRHFVKGPRSAKFVAWLLGVIFFQGGTVSTVLTGTTVKPICDKEKVSHEELSYIVDSTASPIAGIIPFNAWPGYVQAFIYVAGVSWLATEVNRVAFFFDTIKFSFYSIISVFFTLLMCFDKLPFINKQMKDAMKRSRETGQLDAPDAEPLSSSENVADQIAPGYKPNIWEFFIPLFAIIGIAIGTYLTNGSPQVRWAFGIALILAVGMALFRGMGLRDLIIGFEGGLKSVIAGAIILLLAIMIGDLSTDTGSGIYLVELLGGKLPFWILPVMLQSLTMIIAFSTGTSWGTYAVAFPLAMPLAFAVADAQALSNVYLFVSVCFASVLNGSIFGDQCSPISDTTVLSSLTSGCDLMDHVKTQLPPCLVAAALAAIGWTITVLVFA